MVETRKTEAITAKCQRTNKEISSSSEEEENYESDTRNETNLNQFGNDENLLQF